MRFQYSVCHSFEFGLGIEGMTSSQAERENPGCLFRDVAIVEHIPNIKRAWAIARYSKTLRQPLHQLQWSVRACPHSEHSMVLALAAPYQPRRGPCPPQVRLFPRLRYETGWRRASQVASGHRNRAKERLADPFCLRAPYNPNFNASVWCAA